MEQPKTSYIGFIIVTGAAMAAVVIFIGMMNQTWLQKNWSSVRCNPLYMPFAGYAGTDVGSNFMNCTMSSFSTYAGTAMDGMNAQMSVVSDSLGSISSSMADMRGMMGSTRGGFMMIFQMVFGKIANLMASMQYLMIRIQTLMGRIVGVFASLIYSFYGGQQTGASVWAGPIGETARVL
jgi:hypothetical protein